MSKILMPVARITLKKKNNNQNKKPFSVRKDCNSFLIILKYKKQKKQQN